MNPNDFPVTICDICHHEEEHDVFGVCPREDCNVCQDSLAEGEDQI